MFITKRDGKKQKFDAVKIKNALAAAFRSVEHAVTDAELDALTDAVIAKITAFPTTVEEVQDFAEKTLMEKGYFDEVKSFILYRDSRAKARAYRTEIAENFPERELSAVLKGIQADFTEPEYDLMYLSGKFASFAREGADENARYAALVRAAVELTTQEAPKWEFISARLVMADMHFKLAARERERGIDGFFSKLSYLTDRGLYGKYILENYTEEEVNACARLIDAERDKLFTYSSLQLVLKRYVIHDFDGTLLETPQEMFLGIAMHLAMNEKDRMRWVKAFYDMLSLLKVTVATPTLSNSRKPYHQLSSCFIDTVPDSLDGIYRSIDNFSKVSKFGGGMGLYFGKVRATGAPIRGFQGAAGGVIRWIKLVNDTAVAVDQLGMRQGAVAVYLDAWHKDLPEFLQLRTNNGDDRMKAHDVFPAVCYPDLFWRLARDNINAPWYMMCPHEIFTVKGYHLEDSYGADWESKYYDCVQDERISKRVIPVKEVVRLILKSAVETGTPFCFNRDHVNRTNPNPHKGMIYCSKTARKWWCRSPVPAILWCATSHPSSWATSTLRTRRNLKTSCVRRCAGWTTSSTSTSIPWSTPRSTTRSIVPSVSACPAITICSRRTASSGRARSTSPLRTRCLRTSTTTPSRRAATSRRKRGAISSSRARTGRRAPISTSASTSPKGGPLSAKR